MTWARAHLSINSQLASGRVYFPREEALAVLRPKAEALSAAITRLVKKRRLANPRYGFYLILCPEDQAAGATPRSLDRSPDEGPRGSTALPA